VADFSPLLHAPAMRMANADAQRAMRRRSRTYTEGLLVGDAPSGGKICTPRTLASLNDMDNTA